MSDRLIGTKELQERLGIGKCKANEIMHMFEQRKQLYRIGKLLKVRESTLERWLQIECSMK